MTDMNILIMQTHMAAASAAARARRKQEEREEEIMTNYTFSDVNENWEFKIVRAATAAFRSREKLERLIAEESVSGWEMLEKLDNSRVRFKRLKKARDRDRELPASVDPYRTQYAGAEAATMIIAAVLIAWLLTALVFVGVIFVAVLAILFAGTLI